MAVGPGLTARLFFKDLSDKDLRKFLATEILDMLDAIFGGHIAGEELRNVATTLVDFHGVLRDPRGAPISLGSHS